MIVDKQCLNAFVVSKCRVLISRIRFLGIASTACSYALVSVSPILSRDALAQPVKLAAWEVSTFTNFGPSPLQASFTAGGITSGGLERGSGIDTNGFAAGGAWGGNGFSVSGSDANTSIALAEFFTFSLAADEGTRLSLWQIPAHNIRRSATGPDSGQWQYRVGDGDFVNLGAPLTWSSTNSTGNLQSAIDLSSVADLQNVLGNSTIVFRLVPYNAANIFGNIYVSNIAGDDLSVFGSVTSTAASAVFLNGWQLWSGGSEGSLYLNGGLLRVDGASAVIGGKALFASPHGQTSTRTWTIRSGSSTGPVVRTITYRAPDGWITTLDRGLYHLSGSGDAPYISPEYVTANSLPPESTLVTAAERASADVPLVPGTGVSIDVFNGVGGGVSIGTGIPYPATVDGLVPSGETLSPVVDFPAPGTIVSVGNSFNAFFATTTLPPTQVSGLSARNFTLRIETLLKVDAQSDLNSLQPGIQLNIEVASDDGYHLQVGSTVLGFTGDRGFSTTTHRVSFEEAGLYPLVLHFAANATGQSGLELRWTTGSSPVSQIIPQAYLYQSDASADQLITFEEFPTGTVPADNYLAKGVRFTTSPGLQATSAEPNFVPISAPAVLGDPARPPAGPGEASMQFVVPGTTQDAVSEFVSFYVIDAEGVGADVKAFDPAGNEIFSSNVAEGGRSQTLVEIDHPYIARVAVKLGDATEKSAIDQLTFRTPRTVRPVLGLALDEGPFTEGANITGTVSLAEPWYEDLTVAFSAEPVSRFGDLGSVVIPAGQTSAVFSLPVVQDGVQSATLTTSLTASSGTALPVTGSFTLLDIDWPDLVVTSPTIEPETLVSGSNFMVRWQTKNAGRYPVSQSFAERVVVRNTATGQALIEQQVSYNPSSPGNGPIGAGESKQRQYAGRLPDGPAGVGDWSVEVTTDANANVSEYSPSYDAEANNSVQSAVSSTLADYPDLLVQTMNVAPAAGFSSVQAAGSVVVTWTLRNAGTGAAATLFRDRILVVNKTTGQAVANRLVNYDPNAGGNGNIAPGETRQRTDQFPLPAGITAVGELEFKVIANDGPTPIFEYNADGSALANNTAIEVVTSTQETQGPTLSNIRFNSQPFTDGLAVTGSGVVSLNASDASGVGRIDFFARRVAGGGETLFGSSTAPPYSVSWNAESTDSDGLYAIIIRAYDTYGNLTESVQNLNLTLAVPPAPTITAPANNSVLSRGDVAVTGRTQAGRAVTVFVNGSADPAAAPADASGNFVKPLSLADGTSVIGASVSNRAGASTQATVTVEVDRSVPSAPTAVTATAGAGGIVQLSWARPSGAIAGYHVYRSAASAFEVAPTNRITSSLLTATTFRDTPPSDGTYFYRVSAVNTAQTEGDASAAVSAVSDRTAPTAAIVYTPRGAHDAETGEFGTGPVDVSVTVSEPLAATPFLSLSPPGASPVVIDLRRVSDTVFTGNFVITSSIPTGRAVASLSARDVAGNRGTGITSGDGIFIDTAGPKVVSLDIQPSRSVRNDAADPVTVVFTARLDGPVKAGTAPEFSYKLSQSHPTAVVITNVAAGADPLVYTVAQQLPPSAGATPESLQLLFKAVDALGNEGSVIDGQSSFQVYQNELPGLASPVGLTAQGQPAGEVLLGWNPVEGAARYQILRRAAGVGEFVPLIETASVAHTDLPSVDGTYEYRVAAVREENGQTSVGAPGNTATALSDRVPPAPPSNVRLTLVSRGVQVDWDHSPDFITESLTYSIYRTANLPAEPQLAGAKIPGNRATDAAPSPDRPYYFLVAVDSVGNQSTATSWAYLNVDLLPVRTLEINQTDQAAPVVSWSQVSGNIAGYDIYWGPTNALSKLNTSGLLAAGSTSYTDASYTTGTGRTYTVVTVDNNGQESPGRSLELPRLSFSLPEGVTVARGVMNRLTYTVRNDSTETYRNIQLRVELAGREHVSEPFDIEPGSSGEVSVVVGGYAELTGETAPLETTLLYAPEIGEKVFLVRNSSVAVTAGQLLVDLTPGEFTTGGSGLAQFTLTNTSTEQIQILSSGPGAEDSPEVRMTLLDGEGNVLATQPLKITTGADTLLQLDGSTVVQLAPGQSYTSPPVVLQVPSNAPTRMFLRFEVDKVYYKRGEETQVVLNGLQTRREVSTVQTSYFASVGSITPAESNGDVPVVISGTAAARVGGPMPNARLRLFIVRDGFESMREVFTDSTGAFSFNYVPAANEAGGIYEVRAVHPDITDRTTQKSFTIRRVTVSPAEANVRSVKNYVQPVSFNARPGRGVTVTGLRLEYLPQDQEGGVAVPGITVVPDAPVATLGPEQAVRLGARITASLDAPASGVLYLRVSSNESGASGWQKIKLNYQFGPAAALLTPSPRILNTGTNPGDGVAEEITITNNGLIAAESLQFALLQQDGRVAPAWASLIVGDGGPLEVGASRTVSLSFQPGSSVPPGQYGFILRVQSSDGARTDVPISVAVTQAGEGNVEFRVVNPFSEYDANGGVRVGLTGATVLVQNEDVASIERTLATDNLGSALFERLPAGTYKYRVNANKHASSSGRFWIRPGATTTQTVQVAYNPVTIEWSVVPVSIEDRYDVVLEASFETDVRVPVIVMDPPAINLPRMCRGDVVNGEFTITNNGLIRADDFQIPLPPSDGRIKVELRAEIPKSLGAQESVRIPYRVTALQDLGGDCASSADGSQGGNSGGGGNDGGGGSVGGGGDVSSGGGGASGSGGPCIGSYPVAATFIYECDNGDIYPVYGYVYFFYTYWGDCGGSGGGSGWETVFGPQGGGGGGGGGGPSISPKPVPTVECWLIDVRLGRREVTIDNLKDLYRTPSGCSVNTLTRQFEDDIVDLSVPIPGRPGEAVRVLRRYRDGEWRFFDTIDFDPAERAGPYTEIYWQGFRFLAEPNSDGGPSRIFRSGNHVIEVNESSSSSRFRLSSKNSWAVFDAGGSLRSFGRNAETYATMVYSASGKLSYVLAGTGPKVLLTYSWDAAGNLDYVKDHSGRRVDYTWQTIFNGAVDLHKVVAPDGGETTYSYDGFSRPKGGGTIQPAARITRIDDATGKSHFVSYSGGLIVRSILDEQGRGKFFEFTRDQTTGAVLGTVRSTSGRIDERWFHDDGELYEWRVNGAVALKVTRDLRTRTWITTDANGYQWTEKRDENGRTISVINPDGSSRGYEYDPQSGRVVRLHNERGVAVEIQYDARGNTSRITEAAGTALERVVQMDFGNEDELLSVQMPSSGTRHGARIEVSYEPEGDLRQISGPIPGSVREVLQRDELGNITEARDPLGQIWKASYDQRNRPVAVTDPRPGNKQTMFSFDAFNNITEVTAPSQRTVKLEYDINNSLVSVIDPAGKTASNEYDAGGRLAQTADATGRAVANEYDQFDRLVKTKDQEGNEVVLTYASDSVSSRPISIKFPTFTRSIVYNFRDQPVTTTDTFASGSALTTKYTYYPTGELATVEDAAGRVTRYQIDELGRVTEISSPGPDNTRRVSRMTYDGAGNVRAFTNPNGQVWNYEYDVAGQLTAEVTPLGQRTQFAYNALGQLTTIIRPDGARIERDSDAVGMVTQVREFAPDGVLAKTTAYARDDDGRVVGYTESLPGASGGHSSADYDYDLAGRLKSETVRYTKTDGSVFASTISYTYYANGFLQSYTAPSGTVTSYTYDQANRLIGTSVDGVGQFIVNGYDFGAMTGMTLPGGGTKSFEYDGYQRPTRLTSRDAAGQIISEITVARDSNGNVVSRNTGQGESIFAYDPANRLIAGEAGSYAYDANGNRRTYSGTGATEWEYDANDRLISEGTNNYEYDANGSLVRKETPQGVWTFSYDHDGRLVQVVRPDSPTIEYRYDPSGRRIAKIIGGVATYYRYSLFGLCAEYNASGQLNREYGYAASAANGTAPLYLREGGRSYFYHTDHLGAPWQLTNEAGGVVWSANYDDFGKANIQSSLIANHWRLPGQYFDEETGLHYNYNRYYSPETARYVSSDPVKDGTNFYSYAENNPLTFTDPSGLRTQGDSASDDAPIDLSTAGNGKLGFYLVEFNEATGDWEVRHADKVETDHAYVNGILGDLGRHVELGIAHIQANNPGVKRFTLFNNPSEGFVQDMMETARDKFGFTSEPALALSDELRRIQREGQNVHWTTHSQGAVIFAQGMAHAMATQRLFGDPSPSLSKNSVSFHAGANNRWMTDRIAADAGVTVRGYYYNDYDLVPNVIGLNGSPLAMFMSVQFAPLLWAPDSHSQFSPHTLPSSIFGFPRRY